LCDMGMRLKKYPEEKDKSNDEVCHGVKLDLRRIRLLPIFGMFVGPSKEVPVGLEL
jgi:hypothetical protein